CQECAALASEPEAEAFAANAVSILNVTPNDPDLASELATTTPPPQTSRLIEFPGVSRSSLPEWRKELSERVREVQERRAREAALESAEGQPGAVSQLDGSPQLELLPQAEVVPLNPLVAAALRRIERAHQTETEPVDERPNSYSVAAVAYAPQTHCRSESGRGVEVAELIEATSDMESVLETEPVQPDKAHNLVVVPPPVEPTRDVQSNSKPRRMIVDNDPALNYLDSVPTTVRVEPPSYRNASIRSRFVAAVADLIVVALLCTPFAAVLELANSDWSSVGVVAMLAIIFLLVSFIYLTISTALTGRTLGTRLLSLRIVDSRTGLIPTGKQSAGRALVYLGTLLTLGLASLYALVDADRRTPPDRLTGTAVVAV
ncbi:MAG: RDD family protein, partial [Pyrinomonadaceae bacterium]